MEPEQVVPESFDDEDFDPIVVEDVVEENDDNDDSEFEEEEEEDECRVCRGPPWDRGQTESTPSDLQKRPSTTRTLAKSAAPPRAAETFSRAPPTSLAQRRSAC